MSDDMETDAVVACCVALGPLDDCARGRVIAYLRERYEAPLDKIIALMEKAMPALRPLPSRAAAAGPNSIASGGCP